MDSVDISHMGFRLKLIPAIGGSIAAFDLDDVPIMRRAPMPPYDIVESASFPLVPIVNRIPDGKFDFEGTSVDLEGNFMGLPDFIHGFGWRGVWDVVSASDSSADLKFVYTGGEWPWPHEARQQFELSATGLKNTLSVTNKSDKRMPAALGFHPYFPTTPNTILQAEYEGHWVNNELGHVIKRMPGSYRKDFVQGADLIDDVMTDQTHFGWRGAAVLTEPGRPTIRITASPEITNLHVFFPPNGDYVAIEPTAARGDPFGTLPIEYRVLEPGETYSIWMHVSVG